MTNRFLWLGILLLWVAYFASPIFNEANEQIKNSITIGEKIKDKLSLISTSPRWKYPYSDHNAKIDKNGIYDFPFSTLPIVSIRAEENGFFGYFEGIYHRGAEEWSSTSTGLAWWDWPSNYKKRGKKWEREAIIDFIGFNEVSKSIETGIRINGNATRAFPQKSLRLIFKEKGMDNIFYPGEKERSFKTMILRNGGNDWDRALMRDVIVANLSIGLKIETQVAVACNVYLNGEYWGIHYLRPKIDDDYFVNRYGVEKEDISIIESPMDIYRGSIQGMNELTELISFIEKNDMKDSVNYSYISNRIDIESFIDYVIVQMFIVNTDWPQNNWMIWKDLSNKYNKGRWKWILKDTDYGLGFFDKNAFNYNMESKIYQNKGPIGKLFSNLIMNDEFEELYSAKKMLILSNNWSEKHFIETIDSCKTILEPEMQFQINRWRTHSSIKKWDSEVKQIIDFYLKRIDHF